MASNIDPTVPADGSHPTKKSFRDNFSAAKTEIEALQAANPSGSVVGTTDAQTLTNKTLDANNNTISNLAHGSEVDEPSSGVHGVSGSLVGTSDAQTLTNKTIDAANNTITASAANVTATGSTTARTLKDRFADVINPLDEGAAGDGVTDDTAKFTSLEAVFTGRAVDLLGKTYVVTAIPTANLYFNGTWKVSGTNYPSYAFGDTIIAHTSDTGALLSGNTDGTNVNPGPSGQDTARTCAIIASTNSRADFVRAACVASIYSRAKGNVSGVFAGRLSLSYAPQSVNLGTEEGEVYGFGGANVAVIRSQAENERNFNLGTRDSAASGRNSGNIASSGAFAGRGRNARLTPNIVSGAVDSITIDAGGAGYTAGDALAIYDRNATGSGASYSIATVDGSGAITALTKSSGGSGYSDDVDAVVDAPGDYSVNIATANSCTTEATQTANLAANNSRITGIRSANVATDDCDADGQSSGNFASSASDATGNFSACIAASAGLASGVLSAAIAANNCQATADGAVVFGRRTVNDQTRSIAFGDATSGGASTANRKFHVYANGDVDAAGTINGSVTFTDYAEYFENLVSGEIPLGMLVALEGRKVRIAESGDDILGVVSATALVAAGNTPFTWAGRYLTGEFGEPLYDEIPDPDWEPYIDDPNWRVVEGEPWPKIPNPIAQQTVRVRRENPDYNPELDNVPRSGRPEEWTCVGLLGQVHARVSEDTASGDWIAPVSGQGERAAQPTNMRCMEIKQPYDAAKGYAVALCLIR